MDLQELQNLIASGKDIEEILKEHAWQEFEQIVARILEEHGFEVQRNMRFTLNKKRHEVDIIAARFNEILCIDCKKWNMRPGKTTALKKAAQDQTARAKNYKKFKKLKKKAIYPLIVTFLEENIVFADKIPIVPIWRLNEFMLEFPEYQKELKKI
ncbi:TPA: YraN family protein [archaeon]|uniref:YraN family protein n=1 Tax=Candidatus Naiadarchaeum limnaeum TaxID=2756139 RepID=A0A832UNE2_9ARCH|nr:YraN family protein [Candidatus Naiadarchaeum limnaeum]